MAKLVSIQWSHDKLYVVAGSSSVGGLHIKRAFEIDLPAEDSTEASVSKTIISALKNNGISRADAVIVLTRDCVEMRQFEVPPVPAAELPDLVRFQATNHFTSFNDDWAMDFVPIDTDESGHASSVLAVALSPQLLKQMRDCLEGAGLKVRNITLAGSANIELVAPGEKDGKQIIVQKVDDQLNFTALNGKDVVLTRSVKLPSSEPSEHTVQKLGQEYYRTLAAVANQIGPAKMDRVCIIGAAKNHQILAQQFEGDDTRVDFIDPADIGHFDAALIESIGGRTNEFGPTVGSLVPKAKGRKHLIDLLNPRSRPRESETNNRIRIYGGIAAAIVLTVLIGSWWFLSSQKKANDKLGQQLAQLKNENKSAPQILGEIGEIDKWKLADINVLDELDQITTRVPLPDDLIVDNLELKPMASANEVHIGMRARISSSEIDPKLERDLRNRPYIVDPTASNETVKDPDYIKVISKLLRIKLEDREIDEYELEEKPTAQPAEKKPAKEKPTEKK